MLKENNELRLNLFGKFTLEYQNESYNLEQYLSKQLLDVLKVFVLNYKNPISNDWFIQMFWQDNENAINSLKFSIYRLRKMLKNIQGLEQIELIITTNNGYQFNPNIKCIVDVSLFQELYRKIPKEHELDEETIILAEQLESLYQGPVKVDSNYVWFMLMEENYRSDYIIILKKLCNYYIKNGFNDKLKNISLKAATLEPMIEENHFYYIQSLLKTNEASKAFEYYQKSTKMLMDEYALVLSDKMKGLYNYLVDKIEETQHSDTIMSFYKKKNVSGGALYCNNTTFNYIYDIYLRNSQREKQMYYLFVFEIKSKTEIEKYITKIISCFQDSLRSGDIFTRINHYQFLVLLPCKSDDESHMIARRITNNFRKKISKDKATLFYHVENII